MKNRSPDGDTPAWAGAAAMISAARAVGESLARRIRASLARWREADARGPWELDRGPFIGRDQLIARVLSTIHNNSILLTGEEGIGKTSILRELERRLRTIDDPAYLFFPVYIDLESTPESRLFAAAGEAVLREVRLMYPGTLTRVREDPVNDYSHRDLACDLRKAVRALGTTTSKMVRLVLLVDGIDEVDNYHQRTTQRVRGLFMASVAENLVMVASGSSISRQWDREGSPWYNFFEEIELAGLCREDVERLATSLTKGRAKLGDGVVERIAESSAGNPALIHAQCRALLRRSFRQNRRLITVADVGALGTNGGGGSAHTKR
jgi:hypothetical protein